MALSLKNKIVLITGASSGIGEACARQFAEKGCHLILLARRFDRLEILAQELKEKYQTQFYLLKVDVRQQKSVANELNTLPIEWKNIDILINNAGLASGLATVQDGNIEDWEIMIDTNIKGLLYITKSILPNMIQRNSGHIVNLGSIAGHQVYPQGNVYCATKYAINAISQGLKMDLLGTSIRVSSIDPGAVETEFSTVRFGGDTARAKKVYEGMTPLTPDDVADAILYAVTRPTHVNISDMILLPTDQSSAMMIHRKNK